MIRNITLLSIALLCLCAEKLVSQNNTCQGATVACNATFSYPAGVNAGSAQAGPDYGCLGSQPNPAWFILTIGTTGNGQLILRETNSANRDVDFALYGPFPNAGSINCNNLGAPIDCSFDPQSAETITITGAVAGQAYVLLLTNYSNGNTTINMNQTGGTAGLGGPFNVTSAGPFLVTSAPVNLTTVPATSDPNVINENFTGPGITNASLGTFSPAVAGLGVHAVTATANTFGCAATDVVNITVSCPTIATPTPTANPFEACSGASATLSVTALSGATVTWYANSSGGAALGTGTSFTTPALSNNTTYYVEQSNLAGCASPRVAVQVNIQTTPSVSILPNSLNICTGGTALLTANPNPLAGTYAWSGTAQATQSVSVNPAATTVYVVTFTSTAGCTATSNATVTIGSSAPIGLCTNFYVTTGGTSGGSGTQADPVTLARALTLGACQNAVIKVATGAYTLSGPIDIPSGVVIEGGFDPLTWEKTSLQGATTIRRTTSGTYPYDGAAGAPALIAFRVNSSANFRLQDLTITTDNAPAAPANSPGVSTFGLHLVGASNYDIVRCQITAGTAGAGSSGVAGAAGTTAGGNGGNGGNGDPDNESLLRAGGASGSSACGCAGGTGGTNSNVNFYAGGGFAGACGGGTNGGNTNGSANAPNGTGTGFGGGSGGDGCNFFGCTNPGTGGTGGAGAQGTAGTAGTAGPAGTFNAAGLFVPGRGTDGGNGGCGTGGGGGGGGGAESGGLCNDGSGGSGGGGGGGGTGGFGGTGAWGGGAAVAVMLVNNGTGGNFTDCNVIAGTGGAGGSGGTGGTGANGGTGGTGGWGGNCDVGRGGNGGNGGRGGSGGSGGNGAAGLGLAINTVGGTAPTTSNINLNLAAQPVIFKTNINCTNVATNYRSSGAAGTWDFGTNSNPQNQTGGSVSVSYSSLGRRNVIFNGNTYTGFQNVSFNGTAIPNIVLSGATNIGANSYQVCQGATLGLQSDQTGTSYTWDLGGANANPGNVQVIPASVFNTTGTFVIGLTVTNDCCGPVAAQSITLFVDPVPNPTITPDATICSGGQQTISLSGLNGGEVITWSPITNIVSQSPAVNPTSITVNPSNTTIYTALVALSTGGRAACSVNRSHTITVSAPLTASTSTTNTSCSAGGSATAIPANGTGAYTYNWANTGGTIVGNTQTISTLPAGNYFVTITDTGSGCTVSSFATVGVGAGALIASVQNQTSIACFGGNNAAVTLTASGGTAPYSFTWSAGPNGAVRTGLSAGSYTVTASDNSGGGCTATVTVFVGQPSEVSITLVSQTDPTSCIAPNGSITVAASGGTSPYIYTWTPTSGNLATATGLAAGSYDVFATDANGCTVAPINAVLGTPPPPFAGISPSTGTLTCVNAAITLTAFAPGGSTYLWGDGSSASSFVATAPGSQVVTVTDTNGCTATASALINYNTTLPSVSVTPSTAVLDCINTSVTLTANSSTAGVTYNWGGGNNTTSQVVSTASVRGVTVTNPSNGCTASAFATVTSNTTPPAAAVAPSTANLSCSVLSVTLTASPSSGVSYNWGGANTNATLVVNAPGTYPVTITDNTNGCTATADATVTQTTTPPTPSLAGNASLCLTNSSNYTLSTSYTSYAWNVLGGNIVSGGNASSNSASVTWNTPGAGTVQVTVTDTNGCTASTSLSVNINAGISVSNVLTACNVAGTQYSLIFDISGGTPAYNVVGTGGGIAANRFTSNPINAGTSVTVSITDAGGCPAVVLTRSQVCATPAACVPNNGCLGSNLVLGGDFETFNPASPFTNFTSQYDYTNAPGVCTNTNGQNILCQYDFGVATSPTPYNPTWSSDIRDHTTGTGNMMIIDFPTGISSQIWCQTVTLASASDYCFGTYAINLLPSTSPFTPPVFRFTANGTNLGNSSPVLATEQWGFYGYTFNSGVGGSTQLCIWNDNFGPNGYDLAIDDIYIRQQLPGTPPIAADDSFALCQGSTSATGNVLSNDTPNGSPIVTVRVISAPAFSDGQVTLNNAGDFTFTPASTFGTSTTFDYEIVQASGCYDFGRVTITASANPTVTLSPLNASITCATTSVSITANGANAYVWNDNSSNNTLSVSTAGTYTVTGTSVNGCTASASVNVGADLTPPTATISPISSTITCANTTVTLTASGGVSYNWDNGTSLSTLQVGTQGTYLVTVTGSNGCTATTSATVTEDITPPVASINPSAASVTCANPTQVLTASGGSSYLWSNGLGNTAGVTATAGQFTVTVTATNGCTATASSTVTSLNVQPTFTTTTTNTSCFGNCDGTITIVPNAGTAPFNATWSNGTNGLTNSGLCAGAYDFTLTDASGCTTTGSDAVSGPSNPLTVDANSNTLGTCGTLCNGSALAVATGGTLPYTFIWSNGQTTTNATGLCDGNAFVTVTDANGCTVIGSTNVPFRQTNQPTISFNSPLCEGQRAEFETQIYNGQTVVYDWAFNGSPVGSNSNTFAVSSADLDSAGIYSVTVTVDGCPSVPTSVTLVVAELPTIVTLTGGGLFCEGVSATLTAVTGSMAVTPTLTFDWTGPNGFTRSIQSDGSLVFPALTVAQSGRYTVQARTPQGCLSNTYSIDIQVQPIPAAPVLTLSDAFLCEGEMLMLSTTPLAVANPVYEWFLNGLPVGGTLVPAFVVGNVSSTDAGRYQLRVNANGCFSPLSANAFVTVSTAPAVTPTVSSPVCVGAPVTFSAGFSAGLSYAWSGPLGFSGNTASPGIASATVAQSGTYYLVATDRATGCATTASVTLQVNATPATPAAANSGPACAGSAVSLTLAQGGTFGATYTWLDATTGAIIGTSTDANGLLSTSLPAGTYNFAVYASVGGCSGGTSQPTSVTVRPAGTATAFAGPDFGLCGNTSTILTAFAPQGVSGIWSTTGSATIASPTSPNSPVTGLVVGVNRFTWTLTGCDSGSDVLEIIVSDPVLDRAFAGSDQSLCGGVATANLAARATSAGVPGRWEQVSGPLANIASQNTPSTAVTGLQPGRNVFVWSVNGGACGQDSRDSVVLEVVTPLVVSATNDSYTMAPSTPSLNGQSVAGNDAFPNSAVFTLISGTSQGTLEFRGDGSFDYARSSATLDYTETFTYRVCASDACGTYCATATVVVSVEGTNPLANQTDCPFIPNIITPNGDNVNDALVVRCAGDLFSNGVEINIFNRYGDEVFSSKDYHSDWQGTFNGETLPTGTYYYIVKTPRSTDTVKGFFVIQR